MLYLEDFFKDREYRWLFLQDVNISGRWGTGFVRGNLKCNFKVLVFGLRSNFLNTGIRYVIAKRFLNVTDTIGYIVGTSLGNHLHAAVGHIANLAGKTVAIGPIKSREAKANALDLAYKNYTSGNLSHYRDPCLGSQTPRKAFVVPLVTRATSGEPRFAVVILTQKAFGYKLNPCEWGF